MDQLVLFHFAIKREYEIEGVKQTRLYELGLQPGCPWEEIDAVLDQFKQEFVAMKKQQEEAAAKAQAEKEAEQAPLEPEVVS